MTKNRIISFVKAARGETNRDIWHALSGKEFTFDDATDEESEHRELLRHLNSLMLKPGKGREPFEPILVTESGSSAQLSMFATVDRAKLQALAAAVENPIVASRILDVLWCLNPREADVQATIDAYVAAARQMLGASVGEAFKILEAMALIGRAIDLDRMARLNGINDAAFAAVAEEARVAGVLPSALNTRFAALKVLRRLGDDALKAKLDAFADDLFAQGANNPLIVSDLYPDLISLYRLEFEQTEELRKRGALFLEEAAANAEHTTATHYLGAALSLISRSAGLAEIAKRITHRLQTQSYESLFTLQRASHSMDISEMRIGTLRALSNLGCGDFLLKFATLTSSRAVSDLRASAEEHLSSGFVHTIFSATVMDDAGRQVFFVPGAMGSADERERRVRFQISQEEGMSRGLVVSAQIHPILTYARASFSGLSAAAGVLANASAFIRPSRREVFATGLAAYFDLDLVAASRILIPETEGNLRYLVERLGGNPYDRDEEGNFEAQGLGTMLAKHQALLAKSLGEDLLFEIDGLLLYRGGPSLRTDIAHALGVRYGLDADSICGCQMALRLCCGYIPPDNIDAVKAAIDARTNGTFWPREVDDVTTTPSPDANSPLTE